ncbi:histone-arginine methyltransferase METTL23 isoform X2 [Gouania willdenowi]|uniref:histone-arginine methyltransferase METTL23 isoform X2 n=1 Tax=Gouania willdenowi TaxID=441366 RepID=UPI0010569BB1|nr:methyltransferase-like protein 23 isoform X2 [Gouania willdenowi]
MSGEAAPHGAVMDVMDSRQNRTLTFTDKDGSERLSVVVPQGAEPDLGTFLWPSSVVLCQYVWTQRKKIRGLSVLELGAGVALPGVVAALCGAHVTLSDDCDRPLCLQSCRRSCEANLLQGVKVLGLRWGAVTPDLCSLPHIDIIIGSDVFYQPEDFEPLLLTVSFLLNKNPEAQFWTSYQLRSPDWSMVELLVRWKLSCHYVPLCEFGSEGSDVAQSDLPGRHSVHMMVITKL